LHGAELAAQLLLVRAAVDGDSLESHVGRELHAQVAKAAHAEDPDEVARLGLAAPQRIKDGDSGTCHRTCVGRGQLVWDPG
jgi:hypothetical protein